jgi:hypothetical protein
LYAAWTVADLFLPEGLLRDKTGAGAVSAALPDDLGVFVLALAWNGAVAFVVTPLVCLLALKRLSLGYVLAWGNFGLFGVFLGTNSFGNPRPEPVAPGLDVFAGTGVWEISAYLLVAAALANRYRFRQDGWLSGSMTRVSRAEKRWTHGQWATLVVAACLIVLTAWIEHRRAASYQPHKRAYAQLQPSNALAFVLPEASCRVRTSRT